MSANGPRANLTDRRLAKRTIEGIVLTQPHVGVWATPDDDFRIVYDEHDRAWNVHRTDRADAWFGVLDANGPELQAGTLCGSVKHAVRLLQWLGWLPLTGRSYEQLGFCPMRAEWLYRCGPRRLDRIVP